MSRSSNERASPCTNIHLPDVADVRSVAMPNNTIQTGANYGI